VYDALDQVRASVAAEIGADSPDDVVGDEEEAEALMMIRLVCFL
jgi:hypothetical protein